MVSVNFDKRKKSSRKFNFPNKCLCGGKIQKEFNLSTKKEDAVRRCTKGYDCTFIAKERLKQIQKELFNISNHEVQLGSLDITFYRDDFRERLLVPQVQGTDISFSLDDKIVVLVDDVLFTGRTIRAAIDSLNAFGRASAIQLAVLVDRGHREMPIRADYVGKNIPTNDGEHIAVRLEEIDQKDAVIILKHDKLDNS